MSAARKSPTAVSEPDTLVQLDPAVILMADNARFSDAVPPAEAEQMKASILEVGRIMEPVGVTALDTPQNGFTHRLRYGFRRVAGALLANEGGAGVMVPAIVLHDADQASTLKEQVSENVVRKTLSLMDIATAAKRMLDAGMSREEVRQVFQRPLGTKGGVAPASNAWLYLVLGLLDLPKAIQARIHAGDIGLAAAYRLMRAPAEKRIAILEAAEKEMETVRATEDKEEKKFTALSAKITEATQKEQAAETNITNAQAELELAQKLVESKQTEAQQAYQKEQDAKAQVAKAKTEDAKKKAKAALAVVIEKRRVAEQEANTATGRASAAEKSLQREKDAAEKHANAVKSLTAKLEEQRKAAAAKPKPAGEKKPSTKVSPQAIAKAAKEAGVKEGLKKLTGPEMRKFIEDLALVVSYPKVAAIGAAIKECFDSVSTDSLCIKKLAAITGETKKAART